MGAGAVYLGSLDQDITDYVDQESAYVEIQANRLNSLADLTIRDEGRALGLVPLTLRERMDVYVYDAEVRIFGGQIATLTPTVDGLTVIWRAKCQGFDCILDQRLLDADVPDGLTTDAEVVAWIAAWAADLGLTASAYVATLVSGIDLASLGLTRGLTLRKALNKLATAVGGATYWVDEWKRLHWTRPSSAQLVGGSDFESGTSHWALGTGCVVTADAGPAGTGDHALVITSDGSTVRTATQTVNVAGNRRYVVTFDQRSAELAKSRLTLLWKAAGGSTVRTDTLDTVAAVNAWERRSYLKVAPPDAATLVLSFSSGATSYAADNVTAIGEDAAFGASTTPNGTTTRSMERWKRASDAVQPVNRVLVLGNGITGWREHAASISYFGGRPTGVFESVLEDERVTTEDGISSRAAAVFAASAFPRISGGYQTRATGLEAGTWQIVEQEVLAITEIDWIATIRTTFEGAAAMLYEITYGVPEDDLGAAVASAQSAFSSTDPILGAAPADSGADEVPPSLPTGLTFTTGTTQAPDGTLRPYVLATWTPNADVDLAAYELQIDRDSDGDSVLDWVAPVAFRTVAVSCFWDDVLGGVLYGAKLRAVDHHGNVSAWTEVQTVVAGRDTTAPPIPAGLTGAAGLRLAGIRWFPVGVPDLAHYEVRWAQAATPPSDPDEFVYASEAGTIHVSTDLVPDVPWVFQVRAVDRSNNVQTSSADGTAVDASDRTAGWSDPIVVTPVLVGASDVAFNAVVTQLLNAGTMSATHIEGGDLSVGGLPGAATQVTVYDSTGRLAGKWTDSGLYVYEPVTAPALPQRVIRLSNGVLEFSTDGGVTWTTALDADGLHATAVMLGSLSGGPNDLPNAGFEVSAWSTAYSALWTLTADWSADIASARVNVDRSTGDLKLTSYT